MKWHLRNDYRNSMLMTHHYPDLVSDSDCLKQISHAAQPIRSTNCNQIWVVTRHQHGIFAFVSQMSSRRETSVGESRNVSCFPGIVRELKHRISSQLQHTLRQLLTKDSPNYVFPHFFANKGFMEGDPLQKTMFANFHPSLMSFKILRWITSKATNI